MMNKYDEALHSIMYSFRYRVKPKYVYGTEKENFDILEELVEKATPMKVEVIDYDYCYYECPRCGVAICWDGDKEGHKHCIDCGQALDWSEDDENSERNV